MIRGRRGSVRGGSPTTFGGVQSWVSRTSLAFACSCCTVDGVTARRTGTGQLGRGSRNSDLGAQLWLWFLALRGYMIVLATQGAVGPSERQRVAGCTLHQSDASVMCSELYARNWKCQSVQSLVASSMPLARSLTATPLETQVRVTADYIIVTVLSYIRLGPCQFPTCAHAVVATGA